MSWRARELAPGVMRIESILGPRPFSQYLVADERALLVDTGIVSTPNEVILPALAGRQADFVLNSHADVDHFGGNAAVRAAMPGALLLASVEDTPWIEDSDLIMAERYGWYEPHGVGYDTETEAWLAGAMGSSVPVDVQLQGGEVIRLGPSLSVEILPLPGHSPGHLGVWEPSSRSAIVLDAVLAGGLLDTEGRIIHPPPIVDLDAYVGSVRLLQELEPVRLLTAHYDVIEGEAVDVFLDESLAFVGSVRRFVAETLEAERELTLARLYELADPVLGPFTSMPNELCAPLRGALQELVAIGRALESPGGRSWVWAG